MHDAWHCLQITDMFFSTLCASGLTNRRFVLEYKHKGVLGFRFPAGIHSVVVQVEGSDR